MHFILVRKLFTDDIISKVSSLCQSSQLKDSDVTKMPLKEYPKNTLY